MAKGKSDNKKRTGNVEKKEKKVPALPPVKILGVIPFFKMRDEMIKNQDTFVTRTTSNSRMIKKEGVTGIETYIFADEFFPLSLLHYIKKIKLDVLSNKEAVINDPYDGTPFDIEYNDFSESIFYMNEIKEKKEYWENSDQRVIEADMSKAYFRAMLISGFLSKSLHDELISLGKKYRLKLLGTMATQSIERHYILGELQPPPETDRQKEIDRRILRSAWTKTCRRVADAMQVVKSSLGGNFLFYWVDGIYFTDPKKSDYTINQLFFELFNHLGFDWEIKELHYLSINNDKGFIEIKIINKKDDPEEKHRFFYPPKKKIEYILTGTEKDFLNI